MLKFVFCFLVITFFLKAQDIRVIEIVDANLFRTKDSSLISMVNLEVPSVKNEDSSRAALAQKAMALARLHLIKQKLRFEETYKNNCKAAEIKKGHLFRVYPLSEQSINELYLEKGYAVYVPCDTLYMASYSKAGLKSMKNSLGIWQPVRVQDNPDMFNRFRLSVLLLGGEFRKSVLFPPLFGLNYRWSDVLRLVDQDKFKLNASIEAGTFLYFALPYGNFGLEARLGNFYLRGHYDALLPIFFIFHDDELDVFDFWGIDIGLILPFDRKGIELEYNIKTKDGFYISYFSVSFAVY